MADLPVSLYNDSNIFLLSENLGFTIFLVLPPFLTEAFEYFVRHRLLQVCHKIPLPLG